MLNPMDLTGRIILVTGASSGIGKETAILLSQLGACIVMVGRDAERLQETAVQMHGSGHRVEIFELAAIEQLPSWLKSITNEVGLLHGLVNSAGIQNIQPLRLLNYKTFEDVMHVNLNVSISLAKAFRQKGVCHPDSSIVFLSSVMGLVGQSGTAAYAASKGAIIALTKSLAMELAKERIRVNCVAPGLVNTEMTSKFQKQLTPEQLTAIEAMHPLGIGRAQDVANAIAFLLADTGRWITGTSLIVDGGYTAH